jgi:SAM-dependent methyltransferase
MACGWDFEYGTTREEFTFRRCRCGGVYLDPRPAAAALPRIYPPTYYAYDFEAKLGPLVARVKGATERAKAAAYLPYLRAGARLLDVGCGDGHLLALVQAEAPFPLELHGVELNATAGAEASRRGVQVHHGRVEDVTLPPAAYDLIVMNQLIEHVPDPTAVLRHIRAALAPGGHLFLETPNLDSLDARLFRRRYWGGYHLPRHFHLFDRRTLPRLVERAGLDMVAMRPLVCPQFWIISLANWLSSRGHAEPAKRWVSPFSPLWLAPATAIELVQARIWWTSNLQLVARKAE